MAGSWNPYPLAFDPFAIMKSPRDTVEALFRDVAWVDAEKGHCTCPGASLHTRPTKPKDCQIYLSRVPTIYCFHNSCQGAIEEANRTLRKVLSGSSERPYRYQPSPEDKVKKQEREILRRLQCRAKNSRNDILSEFATDPADIFEMSPVRLFDAPENDWRLLLALFQPSDTIWIGDVYHSGEGCEGNFRAVSDWLFEAQAPANFTCPSVFKPGVFSRSKENVNTRPFLVVESDTLTKPEICAVFLWTAQFIRLRAIVDTAGKSLHGWFDFPKSPEIEHELKIILPEIGCDPAMFKPSQPCRMPGAIRGEKHQTLIFLSN